MSTARLFLVGLAGLAVAVEAPAQQAAQPAAPAPTRTVNDYVCAFTGKCAGSTDSQNPVMPEAVRGFRLSVPERRDSQSTTQPNGQSSASGPTRATQQQRVGTRSRGRATARASATEPRRVDLRVSFMLGSAELTPQAREEAKVFAAALRVPELAAKRFRIEGYTDSSGTRAFNMGLSKRRAQAVADFLVSQGVQAGRLEVRGYGPDHPLPGLPASSPDNRRVEARLL